MQVVTHNSVRVQRLDVLSERRVEFDFVVKFRDLLILSNVVARVGTI